MFFIRKLQRGFINSEISIVICDIWMSIVNSLGIIKILFHMIYATIHNLSLVYMVIY